VNEEITPGDRKKTRKTSLSLVYGRGSKIRTPFTKQEFTLIKSTGEFWEALNDRKILLSIHENNIDEILVGSEWVKFDGNPRNWKKVC